MDKPHQSPLLVLRIWLYINACSGLFPMVILGIAALLRSRKSIYEGALKSIETFCFIFLAVKVCIWVCFQLELFKVTMIPYCTGAIFAYGVLLTIIHSFVVFIFLILAFLTGNCRIF